MAQPIQTQIEKTLKTFEARKVELETRRRYASKLFEDAEALNLQANKARREFAEAVPTTEYEEAVKAVAAGSRDVRSMHVYGRAGEVEQLERKSVMAADAAGLVLGEVTAAEQALGDEVAFALRPIWQSLTGEIWQSLIGLTASLDNIRVARDAVHAAGFRGVNCPLSPGFFAHCRIDEDNTATRWFSANETLGLVKPGTLSKAA